MGNLIQTMNVSLDGFVETLDQGLDWANVDDQMYSWFRSNSSPAVEWSGQYRFGFPNRSGFCRSCRSPSRTLVGEHPGLGARQCGPPVRVAAVDRGFAAGEKCHQRAGLGREPVPRLVG